MPDQTDPNDVRGESLTSTTRRGALAALGLGGLAALSGSASADVGGGPDSDAMSEHRVPYYRVAESDLDSPGVVGRRVEITSGGSAYEAGDQLVDTGTSWELIDSNYGLVNTENVNNKVVVPDSASTAAEINAVIASVSDGTEIEIPKGEYTLNEPITTQGKNGIWLHGQGMYSTVLKVADQTSINAVNIVDRDRWRVSHLQVDGNEANQTDEQEEDGQTGIRLGRSIGSDNSGITEWLKVDHCYVHDTVGANFRNTAEGGAIRRIYSMFNVGETCRDASIGLPYHNFANTGDDGGTIRKLWQVHNYGFDSGQIGMELSSGVKEATIIGCHMEGANQNGFATQPTSSANITFIGCHANDINGAGYQPQAEGVQLHASVAEGCDGSGFVLDGVGQQAHGCVSYNNNSEGLVLQQDATAVYGGEFYQNDTQGIRVNGRESYINSPFCHDNDSAGITLFASQVYVDSPRVYDNDKGLVSTGGEVNSYFNSIIGANNVNGLYDIREDKHWINDRAEFSYTGDGTTGRSIDLNRRPSVVYIEDSGGTLYETRDDSLSAINGATPSGELSITDSGVKVGDNGGDSDPNTDTETYQLVAIA